MSRIGGLHASSEDRPSEVEIRQARVEAARRNGRWTEIDDDLVPRGPRGSFLVSVATDAVYTRALGVIFQRGSATIIADYASLHFTVGPDNSLTFYEKLPQPWSEIFAKQARRRRARA